MATIKDIANRLGVSVSTVSKGLNGASDISDELRQMVLDTAVEMGYSTKRSKKVENRKLCIFIENMNYETIDEFGYDIVLGFKQNAFRRKWDVDILPITPAFQEEEKYDTFLLKNGYCGAFLMGLAHPRSMHRSRPLLAQRNRSKGSKKCRPIIFFFRNSTGSK